MTDLELMYLLESEGYEASMENLMILKENEDILFEYKSVNSKKNPRREHHVHSVNELAGKSAKEKFEARFGPGGKGHPRSGLLAVASKEKKGTRSSGSTSSSKKSSIIVKDKLYIPTEQSESKRILHKTGKNVTAPDSQERSQKTLDQKRSNWRRTFKTENGVPTKEPAFSEGDIENMTSDYIDKLNNARKEKGLEPLQLRRSTRRKGTVRDKHLTNVNAGYEFSDYELYRILESNGYITTETNLEILKEGLESGKYLIERPVTDDGEYVSPKDYVATSVMPNSNITGGYNKKTGVTAYAGRTRESEAGLLKKTEALKSKGISEPGRKATED